MTSTNPRVTVGLPVHNGERFLRFSIEAILNQTFTDFELIICNNASTDKTEEICQEYAIKDKRIRYYPNPENIGASPNFNLVFQKARGEYFKWAAHDDICAPEFLEKCVAVLDKNPHVVLCHTMTKVIDDNGNLLTEKEGDLYVKWTNENIKLRTDSVKVQERFRDLTCCPHSCYQIFGLIRTNVLKTTPLIDNYGRSDKVLLARLGLHGRFYQIPEDLFFLRRHASQSINLHTKSLLLFSVWFDPANKGKLIFPRWQYVYEYIVAIHKVYLSWLQKLSCYLTIIELIQQEWLGMLKDIIVATIQITEKAYRKITHNSNPEIEEKLIFNHIPRLYLRN